MDFLGREPDQGGFEYWSEQINQCGSDQACVRARRIGVSAASFVETEIQQSGYFVYRLHKVSFGARPTYSSFMTDRSRVIGGAGLEASKQAFATEWVRRPAFKQAHPDSMSAEQFVSQLFEMAGAGSFQRRATAAERSNAQ